MSHLGNLTVVRDLFKSDLLALLDALPGGNLLLIWERSLMTPINMVVDFNTLKQHRVGSMYIIDEVDGIRQAAGDWDTAVFLVSANPALMEPIARFVKDKNKLPSTKSAAVIFVPSKTIPCENLLRQLKVETRVNLLEFQLDILPLDCDLLLCDQPHCFRDYQLKNDIKGLHYLSRAIMRLQSVFGIIPNIAGKGDAAKRVCDNILRMRREYDLEDAAKIVPQIDNLIIIDRSCDLLTPVVPQLCFEGLVNEVYEIKNSQIVVNVPRDNGFEEKKVTLNSADEQFADLRDRHISGIGRVLSRMTKNLSAQFDERHQASTVADLKKIVTKLPHMQAAKQSLAILTTLTEQIKHYTESDDYMQLFECQLELLRGYDTDKVNPVIEQMMVNEAPLQQVLRLICIQSVCNYGLKPRVLQHYLRELVHVYNVDKLLTMHNLLRAGLIVEQKQSSVKPPSYSALRSTLQLCPDQLNEETPGDIHFATGGYAPISVRIVQKYTQPGWRSVREALDLLPGGAHFEAQQQIKALSVGCGGGEPPLQPVYSTDTKRTLVAFVGGCTHSEISALRFLSQMEEFPADYTVLTTGIIASNRFLDDFIEQATVAAVNPFL